MAIYHLKFLFDYGSGVCLWSTNDAARERFDYPVESSKLPLSDETRARVERLIDRHDESLDWDDPGGPSPWTEGELVAHCVEAQAVLAVLRAELAPDFEIEDRSRMAEYLAGAAAGDPGAGKGAGDAGAVPGA